MKISVRNGFAPESSLDRVDKIVYSVLKLWGVVLCRRELNGVKTMMLKKLKLLVGLLAISGMMMADVTLDVDINLTADADWSGRGTITVPAGIVVNLNGHRLVVDNITGDGRIIDTAATYDLLDGITSTEGGNQWINTGVIPGTTTAITLDFTSGPIVDNLSYFGSGFGASVFLLVGQGVHLRWYGKGNTIGDIEGGVRYVTTVTTDK